MVLLLLVVVVLVFFFFSFTFIRSSWILSLCHYHWYQLRMEQNTKWARNNEKQTNRWNPLCSSKEGSAGQWNRPKVSLLRFGRNEEWKPENEIEQKAMTLPNIELRSANKFRCITGTFTFLCLESSIVLNVSCSITSINKTPMKPEQNQSNHLRHFQFLHSLRMCRCFGNNWL